METRCFLYMLDVSDRAEQKGKKRKKEIKVWILKITWVKSFFCINYIKAWSKIDVNKIWRMNAWCCLCFEP